MYILYYDTATQQTEFFKNYIAFLAWVWLGIDLCPLWFDDEQRGTKIRYKA